MQFQFNISSNSDFSINNFIVSDANEEALTHIEKWPHWGEHNFSNIYFIYGNTGCGKTHLASIWQSKTNATFINITNKHLNPIEITKTGNCFILENIDKELCEANEKFFLHLVNSIIEQKKYLLITCSVSPKNLKIHLPDLRSRVLALPSTAIFTPDAELFKTILIKQFSDRQLRINTNVINYLITRIERSFINAKKIVELLDNKALAEKRNITIPLVKELLDETELIKEKSSYHKDKMPAD